MDYKPTPNLRRFFALQCAHLRRLKNKTTAGASCALASPRVYRMVGFAMRPSEQTLLSSARNVAETATDLCMGRTTVFREQSQLTALISDGASMVAEIGRSMTAALNQGNAVVCIATGTHRRLFEQQLKVRGIDVVGALMREQLVCINALDALTKIMVDGEPDVIRFAEVIGAPVDRVATRYPHVLIFGELDLLLHAGVSGARKLDELFACFVGLALCSFVA